MSGHLDGMIREEVVEGLLRRLLVGGLLGCGYGREDLERVGFHSYMGTWFRLANSLKWTWAATL